MQEIPNWLNAYLRAEDLALVEGALQKAEQATSGEIVPMIVRRSVPVEPIPYFIFILLVLIAFTTESFFVFTSWQTQAISWFTTVLIAAQV